MKHIYKSLVVAGAIVAMTSTAAFAEGSRSKTTPNNPYSPHATESVKDAFINHNGYNSNMKIKGTSAVTTPYRPKSSRFLSQSEVKQVQQALNKNGYKIHADGVWGEETGAAVRSFQRTRRLDVTGHLDAPTLAALQLNNVYVTTTPERRAYYTTSR